VSPGRPAGWTPVPSRARPPAVGALAALGCALAIALPAGVAVHVPTARHGLDSLPALARGSVSAALGREQPVYRVRGLHAINPAQRFRVAFSPRGVAITAGEARLGVTLSAYGTGDTLRALGPATPHVSANRVSYTHGSLTEWFANGPLGVEQGFDVGAPPTSGSGPLTLSMTLSGNLHARLQHGSLLLRGSGAWLRYGGLVAIDARGRPLPSSLELLGHRALIRVEDRGAAYPVRIDPFIQQGELAAAHGARGEEFGESVAISANTIVVGTPNYVVASTDIEQGAAYVFTRPPSGWADATQTAVLTATHGQSEELFGHSVAIYGDTIVVGAPFRKVAKHEGQGAVYVFVKPSAGWRSATQTVKLTAAHGQPNEFFGESVAVSGDTVLAGAPSHRVGKHAMQGAVDVFTMPSCGWAGSPIQKAELTASDGRANDALGISVAISADTIVAGADQHAVAGHPDQGAAYVFVKPTSGWRDATQNAELSDEDGGSGELFAHSVAISGETIVAGAPDRTVGASADAGAAYVFVKPTSGWSGSLTDTAELTASDAAKREVLGGSVAVSGDAIVAGATFKQVGPNAEQGAAYVFVRPSSGWANATQTEQLTASDGAAGDSLGRAVALAGDTILAGAPDRKVAANLGQGAVYAFVNPSPAPASSAATYRPGSSRCGSLSRAPSAGGASRRASRL
jgi:hypothetical protein